MPFIVVANGEAEQGALLCQRSEFLQLAFAIAPLPPYLYLSLTAFFTMAPTKKPTTSPKGRSSGTGPKITLQRVKGENFYRNAKQASRLKMLNGGKPIRDPDGKIIQAAAFQKGEDETKPGRVQPDRRWFGTGIFISHFWNC